MADLISVQEDNTWSDKKKGIVLSVILLVTVGIIISLIVSLSSVASEASDETVPSKEGYLMPAKNPIPVFDHLEYTLSLLRLTNTNPKLVIILEDFVQWIKKNPDQLYGININNPDMPSVVANTYFRQANPDGNYKFTKTNTNVKMLIAALNKIVGEVQSPNLKEGYQSYIPQRLQEFDEWLNDDFPRRKRFDVAMKGANNMPTRFVVSQIINEFVSTNQIPSSEAKNLRENVLSYLQINTSIPNYKQTYNTSPLERFRIILKDNPSAPFMTKFQHYQKVYQEDRLGMELAQFAQWLTIQNPSYLNMLNSASDPTKEGNNIKALQGLVNQIINKYPDKTDLLTKTVVEQLQANIFPKNK